jgi:hypothetical protein
MNKLPTCSLILYQKHQKTNSTQFEQSILFFNDTIDIMYLLCSLD